MLKKESLQRLYSNLKSKLFSASKSIQKVLTANANGSLSPWSLAYAKAEVLKVGATNVCSSPLSYDEVVQGMRLFLL